MPLSNVQLEELELQYFETIYSSLRSNIRGVVDDLQSMNKIKSIGKILLKVVMVMMLVLRELSTPHYKEELQTLVGQILV